MRTSLRTHRCSEGMQMLEYSCVVARLQSHHDRHFILEHPACALSWHQDCIARVSLLPGIQRACFDQCQYGLASPGPVFALECWQTNEEENHIAHKLQCGSRELQWCSLWRTSCLRETSAD
eukprot:4003608-Amphidinium_carterae.2